MRAKQLGLRFRTHGGWRKGAGRKRRGRRRRVSHRKRKPIRGTHPLHVTLRLREGLRSLRSQGTLKVLKRAFAAGCDRFGFRLIHWSVQGNHVHMIVEADDQRALSRGVQGLKVRMARALNKHWGRKGRVFDDRYHARELKTPREVRNALLYVLKNAVRHGLRLKGPLDPFASGFWFTGWKEGALELAGFTGPPPVAEARTWLLKVGWWQRHGLIGMAESPPRAAA